MKNNFFIKTIVLVFAVVMLTVTAQAMTPIDGVAAIVNSQVITQNQLDKQVALIKSRLQKHHVALPGDQVLSQQVLQHMITQALQVQQAKRLGIKASSSDVNAAIQRIAQQNHLTVSQLYASVDKDGFSKQEFEAQIKKEILIQKAEAAEVGSKISISAQQVNDVLSVYKNNKSADEYQLGDIVIALPSSPSPAQVAQARNKAENIIAKLRKGESFQKLAAANSANPQAFQGGALPWQKLAMLPTPFVPYAKTMKAGQVAGPIRTPNGFHVIKLLAKRGSTGLQGTVKQQRREVEEMIFQRELQQASVNWIAQLRAQAYIKIPAN
jgi:peptidyl-prolyl cis-trans isomerase SurA